LLTITIVGPELYDPDTYQFAKGESTTVELEHSLVSLSKWEAKFNKSFLSTKDKTNEETLWYILAMVITPEFDPEWFKYLSVDNYNAIDEYINSKQTATTFSDSKNRGRQTEIITAELIYFWMITHNIPFECQFWHLDKLLTLIRVCVAKTSKPKKLTKAEMAEQTRQLNAQRRANLNTSG